jgi:hypothetical protein
MNRNLLVLFIIILVSICVSCTKETMKDVANTKNSNGYSTPTVSKPNNTEEDIQKTYWGTYLPIDFVVQFLQSRCYVSSMAQATQKGNLPVICVTKNQIYSSEMFHDQYALKLEDYKQNWTGTDIENIKDKNNHLYSKISNGIDYRKEVMQYCLHILVDQNVYKDDVGNKMTYSEDHGLMLNADSYLLMLDILSRESTKMDVLFCQEKGIWFSMKIDSNLVDIFQMKKTDDYLGFDPEEFTMTRIYHLKNAR